ncbi:polysaccharide biosynthesis/export family protein [Edaphobacter modestus]|uniref:polysaccharide biosynthesis/export family protein n=1 Tax=Edaphobacter modestus TaxID=388466 RepID=UPI0013EE6089|nr:polysaccharide biosynthesis/export family protein [Edaphobacter modestus]
MNEYVLGDGDQFVINVQDLEELSAKSFRIDPSGYIDLPLAGPVEATGLTIEQLKTKLVSKLSKYIDSPQISISLTEYSSRPVSIVGSVNAPGIHQLQGPKRLIDVISLAGGTKPDAGSRVIVTREKKWGTLPLPHAVVDPATGISTASLSLEDLMASKTPSENILVSPGDIVSIPKAEVVYVVGNVKKAGGFQLSSHTSITLLQALSLAEGLDRDSASSNSKIIRPAPGGDGNPREIPVNIKAILAGKAPDEPLFGNDILFVPNSGLKSASHRAMDIMQVALGAAIYRF